MTVCDRCKVELEWGKKTRITNISGKIFDIELCNRCFELFKKVIGKFKAEGERS